MNIQTKNRPLSRPCQTRQASLTYRFFVARKRSKRLKFRGAPKRLKFLRPKVNLRLVWATGHAGRGNPLSRLFRRIFENPRVRTVLGANLAFLAMISGVLRSTSVFAMAALPAANTLSDGSAGQPTINLTTKQSIVKPLAQYRTNQGFSLFHPGLDLDAQTGDPIHPIMGGVVIEAGFSWFGYGNTVVVDHQNGYASRYAHLSKLLVRTGDRVSTETILGLVGSTGHSSGPHLHLEVTNSGIRINPRALLE